MRPLLRLRAHPRQKEKQARAYPPTSPAPQGAVSAAPVPLCPPPRPEPGLAAVLAGKPGLGRNGPLYASRGGESRSPAGVQPAAGRHFLALRGDPPGPRPSAWGRVSPASSPRATRRKGGGSWAPHSRSPWRNAQRYHHPRPVPRQRGRRPYLRRGPQHGASLPLPAPRRAAPPSPLGERSSGRAGLLGGGVRGFALAPGSLRALAPATRLRARLLPLVGGSCPRVEEPRPVVR